MSNRKNAFKNDNPNPAQYWIQWGSDLKQFHFYDKVKEKKIAVELPFTFLTLDQLSTIKGWDQNKGTGIYSNEVKRLDQEKLDVRYFEGNEQIARGYWKDIKQEVTNKNGDYHASIYVMLMDGSLANISLRGAALASWFDFTKKTKNRLTDEKITVKSFEEGKNGAVTYYYPVFEFDGAIDDNESDMADNCFDILESYLNEYMVKEKQNIGSKANYLDLDPEEIHYQEQLANAGKDNDQILADDLPF